MSDTTPPRAKLYAALALAIAEVNNPRLTAVNPHLKNKFADLKEVLATVKPVLARHGLGLTQLVGGDNSATELRTIVFHGASGESIEAVQRMVADQKGVNPAQAAGIAITYMRRYAILSMMGIVGDADGDGADYDFNAPKASAALIEAAEVAAKNGREAFLAYWKSITTEERQLLAPETERLKKITESVKGDAK